MWFPDTLSVLEKNPINGFQIAVWHELFDPFTPDNFQPRLLNSATLVEELKSIAERVRNASIWEKHVRVVKEELKRVAAHEDDLLQQLPEYQWRLNSLFKTERANEIVLTCKLLQADGSKYDATVRSDVERSVDSLPKDKFKSARALGRLATIAIHSGRVFDEFSDVVNESNLTVGKQELLHKLINETILQRQMYECVLTVMGERREVQGVVRKAGFQLLKQKAIQESKSPSDIAVENDTSPSVFRYGNVTTIAIQLEALSARDAARDSSKVLRRAIDVFNLYSNNNALVIVGDVFVTRVVDGKQRRINLSDQALRKLHPRKNSDQLTMKVLDSLSRGNAEDRLLNALELYSLSHGGIASRVRLVNLWSATECLAGLEESGSVIDRVCRVFAPIVMWRRVEKMVSYISTNLQKLKEAGAAGTFGSGFPQSLRRDRIHPWETMLTLCKPENHPHILELLKFSSVHPLLCFRVFAAWKELNDPMELRKLLIESKQFIEWQLWRIYRARNLVVHDGVEVQSLPALFDSLHYYFSITVSRLLHSLTLKPEWGLAEAVAHWQSKVGFVLDMLENKPQTLCIADFFPGDTRRKSSPLWTDL